MIKRFITIYMSVVVMVVGVMTLMPAQSAYAGGACTGQFLTFPAWHKGLPKDGDCGLKGPSSLGGDQKTQLSRFIWIIVLNVLEIMLQLVVYIAAGFIIWGGYMYLISGGQSDKVTAGRKMIQNAVVGLIISLFAVFAVSFISGSLGA